MTDDKELIDYIRNLALTDTQQLLAKYVDVEKVKLEIQICKQRKKGLSYLQIALKNNISKSTVYRKCKECNI